ncbi:hypothetical protein, partial [Maribacter dokdonensis]
MKLIGKVLFLLSVFAITTSFMIYVVDNQQEVIEVQTLSEFKKYLNKDNVKVKLAAGNYQI